MSRATTRLPTTTAQYGIWVAQQVDADATAYLTAECTVFDGTLDVVALREAVETVLNHAATLHMRFEWDGNTLWQHQQPPTLRLPLVDLSDAADPLAATSDWKARSLATPCDLRTGPLCTTALLRLSATCHHWYLQVHHAVLDGFGYTLLQQAVAARYNARVAGRPLPLLPDWRLEPVIEAEQRYHAEGGRAADQAFWRNHLRDLPAGARLTPLQEVPTTTPRRHAVRLPREQVAALQAAARASAADGSAWLLAAIGLWLGRHARQRHLAFGLPAMNRLGTPALGVPCMAMNIVPFGLHLSADATMRTLAAQAGAQLRAIRPHLYYRYGWIRADLGLLESGAFLFHQAVNLMPFERHVAFHGVDSRLEPVSGGPVKDLNVTLVVDRGAWVITLEAHPRAYDDARVAALGEDLQRQLATWAVQPPDTPLADWMAALPPPSVCDGGRLGEAPVAVLTRLKRVASAAPAHPAVEGGGQRLTYAALVARVAALAGQLARHGVAPGDRVAALLPRSVDAVVAALAVPWAGAVYVPLDTAGPAERTEALLAAADVRLVLANAPCKAGDRTVLRLDRPFTGDAAPPPCHAAADDAPFCLLFTSGSTGSPKGVRIGHGALAHFVASAGPLYGIGAADRVLQFAPLHFDASLEEILLTLCRGGTLVLRDDAMLDSAQAFAAAAERLALTVLDLPTAYWHALAHAIDAEVAHRLRGVRLFVIGGEAAQAERLSRWRQWLPAATLLNTYGPTETTIIVSTAVLAGAGADAATASPVPIGRPRPGVTLRVVDERRYPVAQGRTGELAVTGPALALDYFGDPARTAQAFVTLPDTGERAYLTGDRVRWQDGRLLFEGRGDGQLKIAGLRIDPFEIENLLLAEPRVREAAVVPLHGEGGVVTLTAAVVLADGDDATHLPALRGGLQCRLPAAAVPDRWEAWPQLPRTATGKVDRRALAAALRSGACAPAGGGTEAVVMQAWQEVLGVVGLTPASHFFALGGKSLQAIQLASRLAQALQREVPVSLLFRHPTVQAQARALADPAPYRPPAAQAPFAPVLEIQPGGPVLFCLYPSEGLAWSYLRLAPHLPGIGVVGLQLDPVAMASAADFGALVECTVQRLRALQPHGPYHLLGWSLGGALAQAVAARLAGEGAAVGLVALMDSYPAEAWRAWPVPTLEDTLRTLLTVNGDFDTAALDGDALRARLLQPDSPFAPLGAGDLDDWAREAWRQTRLFRAFTTERYDGAAVLYQALHNPLDRPRPASWQPFLPADRLEIVGLEASHAGLSDPGPMAHIGAHLAERLRSTEVMQ